jgi:hypothetical protein
MRKHKDLVLLKNRKKKKLPISDRARTSRRTRKGLQTKMARSNSSKGRWADESSWVSKSEKMKADPKTEKGNRTDHRAVRARTVFSAGEQSEKLDRSHWATASMPETEGQNRACGALARARAGLRGRADPASRSEPGQALKQEEFEGNEET